MNVIGLQVTSPKGHWSDIYVKCNDQEHYHMIDVSGNAVRQSQHALTLTLTLSLILTLNPNPVTLRTSELSPRYGLHALELGFFTLYVLIMRHYVRLIFPPCFKTLCSPVRQKPCEMDGWFKSTTYGKPHIANPLMADFVSDHYNLERH